MMATKNDVPARGHLTVSEIARLQGAGARKVVVEHIEGRTTAVASFMDRDWPDQFIALRASIPLERMTPGQRELFIDRCVMRTAEHHETLPPTDEEQAQLDAQEVRR